MIGETMMTKHDYKTIFCDDECSLEFKEEEAVGERMTWWHTKECQEKCKKFEYLYDTVGDRSWESGGHDLGAVSSTRPNTIYKKK